MPLQGERNFDYGESGGRRTVTGFSTGQQQQQENPERNGERSSLDEIVDAANYESDRRNQRQTISDLESLARQ